VSEIEDIRIKLRGLWWAAWSFKSNTPVDIEAEFIEPLAAQILAIIEAKTLPSSQEAELEIASYLWGYRDNPPTHDLEALRRARQILAIIQQAGWIDPDAKTLLGKAGWVKGKPGEPPVLSEEEIGKMRLEKFRSSGYSLDLQPGEVAQAQLDLCMRFYNG